MRQLQTDKSERILFYLLFLTGFFLLLELSFFIQCNRTYLADYVFVSDNLHIPSTILPGIFYFIFAQLLVHLAYCYVIWIIVSLIKNLGFLTSNQIIPLTICTWMLGLITIFTANHYYFPNSKFVELTSLILFNQQVAKDVLIFLLICCCIVFLLALTSLIKSIISRSFVIPLILGLGVTFGFTYLKSGTIIEPNVATRLKPNIILVGVDSLRPDFLSYFGYEKSTPFFDSFLDQAAVFSEAVTPLARTFPSWSGILTGQYPRQIGIRSNLAQQTKLNFASSLPAILQRHGYETIFATDETRFSNIDKNYGFDSVITPPMGLNDFLIGTFNDFPLSNLLINTIIGKWLFPHSYANRPVYFTYEPDSFLNLLSPTLTQHRTKSLFLAVHFCLPHYPYLWASFSGNGLSPRERYGLSIVRVDKQVHALFSILKQNHLLDHAIVVLLSDHGEALELPGDRITEKDLFIPSSSTNPSVPLFYPPSLDKEEVNQSAGHGTDVLGLPQYHSVLAFQLYGVGDYQKTTLPGVVSLLDIMPTLLDLIDISTPKLGGTSLSAAIRGNIHLKMHFSTTTMDMPLRHIFLESDFSPEAIRTVYPETRNVLLEGIELFQIDPHTTRLTVKNDMSEMIIKSKQYADIYSEWMLALYPQNKNFRMPILINLVSGKWTNDLHSPFAQHSPAQLMLAKLKAFYGDEI